MAPDLKAGGSGGLWAVNFYYSFANLLFSPFANFTNSHQIMGCEKAGGKKVPFMDCFPIDVNVAESIPFLASRPVFFFL